jgi:glutaminyl-tRNA synthetase
MGQRKVPFSREIYIEQADFLEEAPRKFFRLAPDREVRLRYAFIIQLEKVIKDDDGNVVEVHCRYDPETRGGDTPDGRKVKGTIHWVSAENCLDADVRLYDRLFTEEFPDGDKEKDFKEFINPDSLEVLTDCKVETSLVEAKPGQSFQFERQGYFCADPLDSKPGKPSFNRTVTLRDSWEKLKNKG